MNTLGQFVYQQILQKAHSATLDLSNINLRSGLYYYQFKNGKNMITGKLLKR